MAIHAAPTEAFWSFDKPQETFVTKGPDTVSHEVEKFLRLALSCNPSAMEILWLDEYQVEHWLGTELIVLRHAFLSARPVAKAYMGYAIQQMGRMNRNPNQTGREKNARHVARLLRQGAFLYHTGSLQLRLPDPERIRTIGKQAADGDMEPLLSLMVDAENIFDKPSALPPHPDRAAVGRFLFRVRDFFLTERLKDPRPKSAPERSPSQTSAAQEKAAARIPWREGHRL
jgi:hypothetical protein